MLNKSTVLISVACLYKNTRGKNRWFLIKQSEEEGWELPRVLTRKGESSVRAILRLLAEKGTMTTKVLEEVGRAGGVTTINGKTLPQRNIFYLINLRSSAKEAIGFSEYLWLEYSKAARKLNAKREIQMLREAQSMAKKINKEKQKNPQSL